MKNTIYLRNQDNNWKIYQYNEINELEDELKKRNIFIADDAYIGERASIGYDACIGEHVHIGKNASIGDNTYIGYHVTIGKHTSIDKNAYIGDHAYIGERASIGYDAYIGEHAHIGKSASINNDIKILKGLYINGSMHPLTYTGGDTVSIGCLKYPIRKWLEKFRIIGEKEGYNDDKIKEYKGYLEIFKTFIENHKKPKTGY